MRASVQLKIGMLLGLLILLSCLSLPAGVWAGEQSLGEKLQAMAIATFPELYARDQETYGLFPIPASVQNSGEHRILVHGLDDPGIIWQYLAPVLSAEGYRVWLLRYPNDQRVVASADFFARELARFLANHPAQPYSLVCHSMGGLVSREMLTSPQIAFASQVAQGTMRYPRQLIMVGTPNHGSQLARLRLVIEIRDQLYGIFNEEYVWLRGIFDGVGEAGEDLIPGSEFLQALNQRPLPEKSRMLLIAGTLAPWQALQNSEFWQALVAQSKWLDSEQARNIKTALESVSSQLGDGLVPVSSVALKGVEMKTVPGNHVSIIRNLLVDDRVPPAVPLILERLRQ